MSLTPIETVEKRFAANLAGRDFIVGDIHGAYELLDEAIASVRFDPACDRLFSLGDLIDRGPSSQRALEFLKQPWFHAIRGNHEDILLETYLHEKHQGFDAILQYQTGREGLGLSWWRDTDEDFRQDLLAHIRRLPILITLETPTGTVGLVHANLPYGASWQDGITSASKGDLDRYYEALFVLWNRDRFRIRLPDNDPLHVVAGIDRVFIGHCILDRPRVLGNFVAIDTGAYKGARAGNPAEGFLTLVDAAASLDRIREAATQIPDKPFFAIERFGVAPAPAAHSTYQISA